MSSLDNAMEMLIVAQNVIEEQKEKIKLLKYKSRKMKNYIYTLEKKLIETKYIKPERLQKKEAATQTADPLVAGEDAAPLCDLVQKLELGAQSRGDQRSSPPSAGGSAVPAGDIKQECDFSLSINSFDDILSEGSQERYLFHAADPTKSLCSESARDVLADYSQSHYGAANLELLENLTESQMENMNLFNQPEIASTLAISEVSNFSQTSETRNELSKQFSVFDELKTSREKCVKTKIKKNLKINKKTKCKKGEVTARRGVHKSPIGNNILNVRSVFAHTEPLLHIQRSRHTQQSSADSNSQEQAAELIRIVEEDQVQLFSTDDKDTFVISLNSDMDPHRIEQLLSDGTLSIHVDDGDKGSLPASHSVCTGAPVHRAAHSGDLVIFIEEEKNTNSTNGSDHQAVPDDDAGCTSSWNQQQIQIPSSNLDRDNAKRPAKKTFTCPDCKKEFLKKYNYTSHLSKSSVNSYSREEVAGSI